MALRIWLLIAVLTVGSLVAASGVWLTGSRYWLLAVPAALAAAWLFVANPLTCEAKCSRR